MNPKSLPQQISSFGRTARTAWTAIWEPHYAHDENATRQLLLALIGSGMGGASITFADQAAVGTSSDAVIDDDDFSAVAAFGANEDDVRRDVQIWAHNSCVLLATRMHEWSGWPMLGITGQHYCVLRPDGALVHAYGVHKDDAGHTSHFDKLAIRYGVSGEEWVSQDPERCANQCDEAGRADVDVFLQSAWMGAVFPASQRYAAPIRYFEDLP